VSSVPSWSPDGRRIAFSAGAPYADTSIATIRPDGSALRTLVAAPAADETGDVLSGPGWSPDGRSILYYDEEYLCGSKCSEVNLMVMRQDGSRRRPLAYHVGSATWSPDGRQLIGQDGGGWPHRGRLSQRRAPLRGRLSLRMELAAAALAPISPHVEEY
jgi:Tol biopolymer transport system component